MRLNYDEEDKVEVQMSPLIDCVFLLLIFFLVTTMMKKWEMQIPLSLPSMTSSLSTTRAGEEAVIIAVDEEKNVYQVVGHDAYTGENHYVPISDLNTFLTELRNSEGTEIAIDVAAFAVMSNHLHVVLRVDIDSANRWTDREVLEQWHKLFKGDELTQKFAKGELVEAHEVNSY